MPKIFVQLTFLLLTLVLLFPFFSAKIAWADPSNDCTFKFYDASDLTTEITPNQNMEYLTVSIESTVIIADSYRAIIRQPSGSAADDLIINRIDFNPGTESFLTFKPPSGWQAGNYQLFFIPQGQPIDKAACITAIPVSPAAPRACSIDIENKLSLTPATPVTLLVNDLHGGCYDIFVNDKEQSSDFCADGKTRQNLGTFPANQTYTVELKTQCLWLGDLFRTCVSRAVCNSAQFRVNPLGGVPPGATEPICSISPDPETTRRPISTFDPISLTAVNLNKQITYNVWGRKVSDPNIHSLGSTDTDGFGNFSFLLHDPVTSKIPTPAGDYEVRLYDRGNQDPPVCSKTYTILDAAKIGPPPIAQKCNPATDPNCTSAGGDPCGDARGPAFKTAIGCIHTNPAEFTKDLLTFVIGIGGGLAFLMMLLGAFQMLTSAGNPETLAAGRQRLTSAVIGLLFIIFAVLLLQIIGADILKIEKFER